MAYSSSRLTWLAVLGVVYGDIGTSPLYALKGCSSHNVLGLISLFLWTIFLIVTLKYVGHILKLDNKGEGGILALVTLTKHLGWGVLGLAFFLGDSFLTPAISVLGALEGVGVAFPQWPIMHWIPVMASFLLLCLFALQRLGTHKVGKIFGPVMVVWFTVLALLGIPAICANPYILSAFNPMCAINFLLHESTSVWSVLGHALLSVTGAEALYADLGHFGRKPIQKVWLCFVWPALVLNYLGQGAVMLTAPAENPFYALAPSWGVMPLLVLATMSSLVASQAMISGVFSLVWQGMMLNYFPRMRVLHTSVHHAGQIYIPAINTLMMIGTLLAVGLFQSSERLANVYGLSVVSLMWMTTIMALTVRPVSRWHIALCVIGLFEFGLLCSSLTKFWLGAWYTFILTGAAWYAINVWRRNYKFIYRRVASKTIESIASHIKSNPRLPGVGVFVQKINEGPSCAPLSLVLHEQYYAWLPETVICVNIVVSHDVSKVKIEHRYTAHTLARNFHVVHAQYGFKETPDMNRVMTWIRDHDFLPAGEKKTPLFYWGRVMPVGSDQIKMLSGVGEKLFILLARLQISQHELIRTPYASTLELVTHVKI